MSTQLLPPRQGESAELRELRLEVREFLADLPAHLTSELGGVDVWLSKWNPELSALIAERGWVGMTIPKEYGGHGRTFLERFVVTEELVAAGAPVGAHWAADRQIAPGLLKFGTEELKREWLPKIAAGQAFFGIGLSEPDSGSDLASVRTKATKVDGGWRINGTKLWTSGAHEAHAFIVFVRTAPLDTAHRHAGLSQILVPMDAPGVEVRPIISASGSHHFNTVVLEDVFVPEGNLVGEEGNGWAQVNAELAFERSGPERFLSTFQLTRAGLLDPALDDQLDVAEIGRHLATYSAFHEMSRSIAGALHRGENPEIPASLVKLLGTTFEGDVAEWMDLAVSSAPGAREETRALARAALAQRPGFTIRGGTNEILRGVIARGLGMR